MSGNTIGYADPSIKFNSASGYVSGITNSNGTVTVPYYISEKSQRDALSTVDDDDKIEMSHNHIHIQPANNGFIMTMKTKHDGIKTYCFNDFESVVNYMKDLTLMDLDSERVAENV